MIDKYNPIDFPIKISCKAADTVNIDMLKTFQGKLKSLSESNRDKLVISICKRGFTAPVFVWINNDTFYILDGHQRVDSIFYMRELGWEIPELPVVYIEADSVEDAKDKLLAITSQYGEFDKDILQDWFKDLDDVEDSLRLVDSELSFVDDCDFEEEENEKPTKVSEPDICTCPKCGHSWSE